MVLCQGFLILRQQKIYHQAYHFAWSEVLTRVLVQRLVEFADKLLEDITHVMIRYFIRMEVNILELFHYQEEEIRLVKFGDGIVEVKFLQHFTHIIAESVDIGP